MLNGYLKRIFELINRGDAREESFYSVLEELLKQWAESVATTDIKITTLPKKTEAGNPDFRVWDGRQHIIGYIEAKAPTFEHLDQIEETEQLKRYRHTFPNLILTNFFEKFRNLELPSLIEQLGKTPFKERVELDSLFLKILGFPDNEIQQWLPKLYKILMDDIKERKIVST